MENQNSEQNKLPQPELDLPLPQKELSSHSAPRLQGDALEPQSVFRNKIFILFIVISFLVAFLIGGFALGRNSVYKELNPTAPAIPSPDPVVYEPTPTLMPDETSDWKTYTNSVFDVNFKYPSSFVVTDKLPATKKTGVSPTENLVLNDSNRREFTLWVNPGGFGPFFTTTKSYDELAYSEDKGIYVVKETNLPADQNQDSKKTVIMAPQDLSLEGHNFFLMFSYNKDDVEGEDVFKKILSTFKFTK